MAEPSNVNRVSAGALSIDDDQRRPSDGAWFRMANDLYGGAKWQRIGGIVNGGATRLALDARSAFVRANRAADAAPPRV